MRPELEEFINKKSKIAKPQARLMAGIIENSLPKSQPILALHMGTRRITVLTDTMLMQSNGGKVETIQLKAVTAVKQKATSAKVETSTESMEIKAGTNKIGFPEYKSLPIFVKAIRDAL